MNNNLEINLREINGYEIINFLNNLSINSNELCDVSIVQNSFVFESQKIIEDKKMAEGRDESYVLKFSASYNNWGTDQIIPGNEIRIHNKGVQVDVGEPFEGDGTDEALEQAIEEWLKTHKFDPNSEEKFYAILSDAYEQLPGISLESKDELQEVIDTLVKAKTYMK